MVEVQRELIKSPESRDAIFDENHFSSIPRPKDIIPHSVESQRDDHSDDIPKAIDDEISSIMENDTWVLSDLPPGCKWILKRKMKVDETINKFKARLVVQGFRKKEGIDYFDTYAPVARITTIRLLLALVAIHNLMIYQMDVKTSFLNGDLDEEVYMKQHEGFVMPGNKHKVCKLVKSLYGLKQAPKQWHQKFDEVVLSSGFLLNQSDKCVYSKFDDSGKGVIICLYVDDMLIFGTDQNKVDKTKKFLSSRFSMKDMGEADVILGIKIKRKNKGIVITKSHYIEKILEKFNHEDCSLVSTLMDPVEKLRPNIGKPVDQLEYSRAIGCLMYDMTSTKLILLMHLVEAYSDASWINHVEDSSSASGCVFLLEGCVILWAFKKQTCITGSTMEYEFVALASADLDTMSIDDLYNNFKIFEQEVKRTDASSSNSGSPNMAFLSSHGSTNEVDAASIQVSDVSTPVSTVSSYDNTANLSDATVYAFLANQPNGSQLMHEDLEQIHEDDLEEIDLKWQLALLSMRARRSPRNQESRTRNQDNSRKTVNVEDTSSKAMVAIDGACLFPPPTIDLSNSGLEEFQRPEFKGYGPKDSKSSEEMVLISDNVQHKPEQANQPRKVSQNPRNNRTNWNEMSTQKLGVRRNFVPTAVLTKSGIVSISTARQSSSRAATPVIAARPINTVVSKPLVNVAKSRQNALQTTHSLSRRPFCQQTALKNINLNNNVNTAKENSVNTTKGNKVTSIVGNQGTNIVKSSACWVWRSKIKVQDHVLKNSGSYICKRFDYVDPEGRLKSEIYPTSLTLNSMMEGMLPLGEELMVVRLLAKAQSELLADESQVLLKVSRKNNMYNFDMKNIVPQKDLTCLLAKATNDESMLWHRRLGHINFKNINKLVKDNLVRGLPLKHLKNDQTCVACLKGKQHKVFGAVNTACYVQNRVLVVKPHFKTPCELFKGRSPALSFMRPFGCHVSILNTLNQLGKFDGKSDEGIFVGYSTTSKAFRVYNIRTRNVEENMHITFLENKPMIAGGGPKWLFDIDALSKSINYAPIFAGTNSNDFAGKGASFDAGQSRMETGSSQDYILMPLWKDNSLYDSPLQASNGHNQDKHGPSQASESDNQNRSSAESSTKIVNTVGPVNTATPTYVDYPNDLLISDLEDAGIFDDAYDDRDEGAEH
nr:zinc finger, CCHC-type [Tanacetum cinerariifolium]